MNYVRFANGRILNNNGAETQQPKEGQVNTHRDTLADHEEWRVVFEVASLLKETCQSLSLPEEREWLSFVLGEAADNMRSTVIWASGQQREADSAAAARSGLVVAADAARGDAVVASYCLDFMRSQKLIDHEAALAIDDRLQALADSLNGLAIRLRDWNEPTSQYRDS